MSLPILIPLTKLVAGDTWPGIAELRVRIAGTAPTSQLTAVTMRLVRTDSRSAVPIIIPVQIVDPLLWIMRVPALIIPGVSTGRYKYHITCTDAAGTVQTYFKGEILITSKI
ncbi:MAG: hypothetical protein ACRC2U_05135 [Aeromonas sp.]